MTVTCEATRYRVRIEADPDAESPREWCNVGTMACWHRHYNLGDEQPKEDSAEWLMNLAVEACPRLGEILDKWENESWETVRESCGSYDEAEAIIHPHRQELIRWVLDRYYIILPLHLYDHSGITMNTGGFSCPWDSGQVGYIYCTKERAIAEWGEDCLDRAEDYLRSEVEVYDQYLRGDVYGFIVEETEDEDNDTAVWEQTDSCWGFFGSDVDKNGITNHLVSDDLCQMARDAEIEYPRN